jgi:hypothetical protein
LKPPQPGPRNEWDSLLGPFYLVPAVAEWIGVSATTVRGRIAARQLIGLKTTDRRWILPSFQFDKRGVVPARLADVMAVVDPGNVDPWGSVALVRERTDFLDGRSPIEALRAGDIDQVLALAIQYGEPLRELFPGTLELGVTRALRVETGPGAQAHTTGGLTHGTADGEQGALVWPRPGRRQRRRHTREG